MRMTQFITKWIFRNKITLVLKMGMWSKALITDSTMKGDERAIN